jgi:hypothetical protein
VGWSQDLCAEDLKIEATLVWATNSDEVKEKHKAIDPTLAKELKGIFQWKHYYEIRKTNDVVISRTTKAVKISDKCQVEITELAGPNVEVRLIGEGKPVNKTSKPLQRGEFFTIGGGDKGGGAWFVVIRQLE